MPNVKYLVSDGWRGREGPRQPMNLESCLLPYAVLPRVELLTYLSPMQNLSSLKVKTRCLPSSIVSSIQQVRGRQAEEMASSPQ